MQLSSEDLLSTFKEFWHKWAERKKQSKTIDEIKTYFDNGITAIGTGKHERGRDYVVTPKNRTVC